MYVTYYTGEHNIWFGKEENLVDGVIMPEIDMWNDLKLIPVKVDIVTPKVETKTLEIPGAHGNINMTNFLTGYPIYKMRTGSLEFRLLEDANKSDTIDILMRKVHGRTLNLFEGVKVDGEVVPSDWFFTGYFEVDYTTEDQYTTVKINYELDPFKRNRTQNVIRLTNEQRVDLQLIKGQYPIMVKPYLETNEPELISKLWLKNDELEINETVTLSSGYNYFGSLMRISNLDDTEGKELFFRMTGPPSAVVTITYYDSKL